MTDLIAVLSSGKGTIAHIDRVINGMEWNKVYLITNSIYQDSYKSEKCQNIMIDENRTISEIKKTIVNGLRGKIDDLEVAVNFVSGAGKEHMALVAALLELGLGIRLIALTKEGVREI